MYSLAYSPCPNDTFIFAALTNGLLPDAPQVNVVLDDVEALNAAAAEGRYELTKVSYGAIPYLTDHYRILRSGGALGRGVGPLLVAREPRELASFGPDARFAIPGKRTTAYLLLRLALGREPNVVVMRFDRIMDAVLAGEVDAGLIIHESRFTYAGLGLHKVIDVGDWWEATTGNPLPLGAILVRRDIAPERGRAIDDAIRRSLAFAYEREEAIIDYVREHAFEMDDEVMHKHIALYVNDFTRDLGTDGIAAVDALFARAADAGLIPATRHPEFV